MNKEDIKCNKYDTSSIVLPNAQRNHAKLIDRQFRCVN